MTGYSADELKAFDVSLDGQRIVSLSFSATFYFTEDFSRLVDPLRAVYAESLASFPAGTMKWYATENMSKYKPVAKRTLGMFDIWLQEVPPRPLIHIHLRDGVDYANTPDFGLWIWGKHEGATGYGEHSNMIRLQFPAEYAWKQEVAMLELVKRIAQALPVRSGIAGLALERNDSRRLQSDANAWRLSMDHPGLDVANEIRDSRAVGTDGIKGVNWLTMLDDRFVTELGGEAALRVALPNVAAVERAGQTLIIRATAQPIIGWLHNDEPLDRYKEVFRAVAPLVRRTADRPYGSFAFPLSVPLPEMMQRTRDWVLRLGDGT